MIVKMSEFAAGRHVPANAFSHFTGSVEELEEYCSRAVEAGMTNPGYRDGVIEVPITSDIASRIRVGFVKLTPEFVANHGEVLDSLELTFERRVGADPDEVPFLHQVARCQKPQADGGIIALYSAELLLEEDGIESPEGVEWQIITINATIAGQEDVSGMPLEAMYRNSAGLPGGTKADFSAEQWEAAAGRHLTCINICEPTVE